MWLRTSDDNNPQVEELGFLDDHLPGEKDGLRIQMPPRCSRSGAPGGRSRSHDMLHLSFDLSPWVQLRGSVDGLLSASEIIHNPIGFSVIGYQVDEL